MRKLTLTLFLITFASKLIASYPVVQTGGGGIPLWMPLTFYQADVHVNESDKIYRSTVAHTSSATFPPDLTAGRWVEVSDDLNREADGSVTDRSVVVWDGTTGDDVLPSLVFIDVAGVVTGATQINVDQLRLDGNDISTTTTNTNLTLSPDGTGRVVINSDLDVLGTITNISQTALDVTNANIIVNDGGNQATADANDAGLIIEMSDATDAQIGYDSSCATFFLTGEVGSLDCLVSESATQSLTNKELGNSAAIDANLVLDLVSTTKASKPCPAMSEVQRDALTAITGSCVYNTDTLTYNLFNGTIWTSIGGGINLWGTATTYQVGDVVHESDKIYRSTVVHTSGVFATDLGAGRWVELSDDLSREADGTVVDNRIVRWDGTTGDNVENSLVAIDDSGNVTGALSVQASNVLMSNSSLTATTTDNLSLGSATSTLNYFSDTSNAIESNRVAFSNASGFLDSSASFTYTSGTDTLLVGGLQSSGATLSNPVADSPISLGDVVNLPHLTALTADPAVGNSHLFMDSSDDLKTVDSNGAEFLVKRRSEEDFLINPSFEKSFAGSETLGWTLVAGTPSLVASTIGGGAQALSLALAAQTLDLSQGFSCDDYVGDKINFSAKVTTSLTGVELCVYSGTNKLSCDSHDGEGYNSLSVSASPILGSNCVVRLESSSNLTGTVVADEFSFDSKAPSTVLVIDETLETVGRGNAGTAITNNVTPVDFTTVSDESGAWSGSQYTVPTEGDISISGSVVTTATSQYSVLLFVDGSLRALIGDATPSVNTTTFNYMGEFSAGEVIEIRLSLDSTLSNSTTSHHINIKFSRTKTNVIQESDLVSSDTLNFVFKSTAIDCNVDAPGTYNTYSFAASSNARTLCVVPPDGPPNNTDGIPISSRIFTSATDCALNSPSRVEVCLGPELRGVQLFGYELAARGGLTAKPTHIIFDNVSEDGFSVSEYNESSGKLVLDSGIAFSSSITARGFITETGSRIPSSFWHFSASKNPIVNGIDAQVGDVCYVKHTTAAGVGGGAVSTANTDFTRVLNTTQGDCGFLNLSSNQFTINSGEYEIEGAVSGLGIGAFTSFIFNSSGGAVVPDCIGMGGSSPTAGAASTGTQGDKSIISCRLNVNSPTQTFELIMHAGSVNLSGFALGSFSTATVGNTHAYLKLRKVK